MAQGYRCRQCGKIITVGVPTIALTQEVSAELSREFGRIIVYHDWSPAGTDRALRERADQLWQAKCEAHFARTGNLRDVPATCPQCGASHPWDIALGMSAD